MNGKTVSICCFGEGRHDYAADRALVAVDVIRATTTAVTAISSGRECHLVPTLRAAFDTASRVPNALLTGELGGEMPAGFELTNSPAQLAARTDTSRPLVLRTTARARRNPFVADRSRSGSASRPNRTWRRAWTWPAR